MNAALWATRHLLIQHNIIVILYNINIIYCKWKNIALLFIDNIILSITELYKQCFLNETSEFFSSALVIAIKTNLCNRISLIETFVMTCSI